MPTSGGFLCVPCGRFMSPARNSVTVEELLEDGGPYKLWSADLWECAECGNAVIGGFGTEPLAEHYESIYAAVRARRGYIYRGRPR
jgi:hypothetical protein